MEKFGKSQPVKRVEDTRFLTGEGRYVDDIAPPAALHAYFFRAPVAHAKIASLDVADALEVEGVACVVTQADLLAAGVEATLPGTQVDNRDGSKGAAPTRPLLATGRVRYVGEPLAMIVAETLDQARDAAEMILFDYEDLETSMALARGGAQLHDEASGNLAFDWGLGDEAAAEKAFLEAAHVVSLEVGDNRVIVNSMEPRGAYAEWEDGRIHVANNGQGVWGTKGHVVRVLGLEPEQVRVTNPDTGGGFGMKAMIYQEPLLVAYAAKLLEKPVRWIGERTESMLSDNAGRDLISVAEMAFDADLKATAYRVKSVANMGAYNSQFAQAIQTQLFSRVLMGVYDVQTTWLQVDGVYTNTTPVDAYRGAGRPEAIYVLERLMDRAARELGVSGYELRRRNFIPKAAFPYKTATDETYDVGDFDRVLSRLEAFGDVVGFESRKAASAKAGKLRGAGLCYYIESILGDPSESARVEFNEDSTVSIYVGTQSNGQGHETVYAQFLSDQTGIPTHVIEVVQGDSDRIKQGGGTGGSRSVTVQNTATLATVETMIKAFTPYIADKMGVDAEDVTFDDEQFRAEGSNLHPTLLEASAMARADGRLDLMVHEERTTLPARSFPNGAHLAEVEVDPETGQVTLEKYTVVDDFGNLINPMLAEGQVHGGVAQGIGQALMEHVVYDDEGQLLTATFMDYAMPRAGDMPMIGFTTEAVPSTANVMGMKGCGEAGTVGAMAAAANAVQDALWEHGVRQADMPFTPHRVWQMLKEAKDRVS
ncbi:xanthine dehydrogenase family protein molybdopterin-binding subunit [Shimia marina]|uniref:Carbon monoxide dehydrogenase large chain n=1 Tax=Shimia marina TaxID=321267 RepID=A0A0P1FFZ8_9RHOB|nr:xanthine dehydrogenase family protein molybdopterin-binding subunit [Shimia marina]CUH52511.1 Carbon monoxide dehydrogenase large chain [Shimia marina]SFE48632.1 carbon-monoxide dehydrogenase large subunit [Shimia marina]